MASVCPILRLHDDALEAVLLSCDVSSIGRIGQTCRRLSSYCTLEPNRTHWKRNLIRRLELPPHGVRITRVNPEHSYRSLLRTMPRIKKNCDDQYVVKINRDNQYVPWNTDGNTDAQDEGWDNYTLDMNSRNTNVRDVMDKCVRDLITTACYCGNDEIALGVTYVFYFEAASNEEPIVNLPTAAEHAVSGKDLAHAMGVAFQSTDYSYDMIASQAIRGNLHSARGFRGIGSYAHTANGSPAWWRLVFSKPVTVAYLRVYGLPGYGRRLRNVTVRLLNGKNEVVQEVVVKNPGCREVFVVCFPTPVAEVNQCVLSKPFARSGGDEDALDLNAVQVFDHPSISVLKNKISSCPKSK